MEASFSSSSSSSKNKEAHLVFIPCPGISHMVSILEFAKLLVTRDHRLSITIFLIKLPSDSHHAAYTQSLSSFPHRIHVITLTLTDSDSKPDSHSVSDGSFIYSLIDSMKPRVKDAVSNLTRSHSLAAFVIDMFCTTMVDVATHFHLPTFIFYTSGVATLGLLLHLHTLRERHNFDATELDGTDTELSIPSFANPVPARVLPTTVLRKEWEHLFLAYVKGLKRADGFIVNSFEELESHAVRSFSDGDLPIYPVGPILNLNNGGEAHDEIINWLDEQPPLSVVFLCFGSMGWFGEEQVKEIARALEGSGARFLWSLRKPPPEGSMGIPSDYSLDELSAILPEGFLDRTAETGRVIGWAPQAQVLGHQATGGFVSHCGWNSILESIRCGVPMATWPLQAEQQPNAFEMVRELKLGVEISLEYRTELGGGSKSVLSAEKIERGIRKVMDKDGEVRKRVKEMSCMSSRTLEQGGGCSYSHLGRFIDSIMDHPPHPHPL